MSTISPARPGSDQHSLQEIDIREAVAHAAHLLPAQGPIGVFIHHNTLHAFQHLKFEEAVCAASEVFGTEPFLREEAYRQHLKTGRIRPEDVETVLDREPTEPIVLGGLDRRILRKKLLLNDYRPFEPATIQWQLEETGLITSEELFTACKDLVRDPETSRARGAQRSTDVDEAIHPLLIRLCGAYLDQGIAYWPMPNRELGFLRCVRVLLSQPLGLLPKYLQTLDEEFRAQERAGMDAVSVVVSALDRLGVPKGDSQDAIQLELLALPGWAGMMHRLEQEPGLAPHKRLPWSLMDYLAVRLTMRVVASARIPARVAQNEPNFEAERLAQAARIFSVCNILGLSSGDLRALDSASRQRLVYEIVAFGDVERRRVLHLAYELRHELDILGPIQSHRQTHPPTPSLKRPSAQVFFCIDEREESTRRHLEEIAPEVETHSAAGFFAVAMEYTGIDDAHGVPLCPVVVKPQHGIREKALEADKHLHGARSRRRKFLAKILRGTLVSSRSLVRGWVTTGVTGLLSAIPLTARVLAPLHYTRAQKWLQDTLLPKPRTELDFVRDTSQNGMAVDNLLQGFTTAEMIVRVANVLGPAGLRDVFSRVVVVLGHGSTSWNNPHESAHDCGACGGRRGGPNGRIFAAMANHPEVREGLIARGIRIPDDTWFIGGYHDTCSDDVDLYDLDRLPETHREDLHRVRAELDRARAMEAMERARRFEAASDDSGPAEALRHVQERAGHLAEPRPEYGHCTNAVCIVGRRPVTRGLFLDRRSFLVSYDATVDPNDEGLAALLGAAIPVCAGISLEYYFSYVDNEKYGCGTKLPHNITGLIGVMNGHASDLRTGLPLQMVEIHEPVRILFVIETTPDRLMRVISANAGVSELVNNRWIRLATLDPVTGEVLVRRDHGFEKLGEYSEPVPTAATSADWFRGKLEHLQIARVGEF